MMNLPRTRWLPLLSLAIVLAMRATNAESLPSEYQIKAAFVVNFARYVEWPQESLREGAPVTFCVLAYDEIYSSLQNLTRGKAVNGHPIALSKVSGADQLRNCHVLVVGKQELGRQLRVRTCLANSSTLTISDSNEFERVGGVIGLVLDNNKLGFEIDLDTAARSNLKLSSQLLKLAKIVHHEGGAGK